MSIVKFEYDAATAVDGYKTYEITLSDYGIRAGQQVGIICIGGGGAGGGVKGGYSVGNVAKGGDAGKAGGGYGGGGGIGIGAGGGGAAGLSDYAYQPYSGADWESRRCAVGSGGGGAGYLASDVITVTDAIVAATIIVSVGKGGTGGYDTGADGNPTSFGTYVTANGGVGGGGGSPGGYYGTVVSKGGGSGRANGGNGYGTQYNSSNTYQYYGGGGAGGFIIGQPVAGNGVNASASAGAGAGGGLTTGGGAQPGQDGSDGHGACFMIWED